jgi:DnaJ-class molecular chaperone
MDFFISDWMRAKLSRATHYFKYVYGWRQQDCTACNGSGRYDHNGSPKCSSCEGTGKETYRGPKAVDNPIVRCAPQLAELAKKMKERRDEIK